MSAQRILDAAAVEFAERGLHGVRMEHVARRAGLNKALVYRHFGDRDRLFDETLRRQIAQRTALLATLPESLAGMLRTWSRRQHADADFLRLIAQEGLVHDGREPRAADDRRSYYRRQIALLERLRAAGRLPRGMDIEALFFALLLLTVGPVLLPQIQALILDGNDAERWEAFLAQLSGALESAAVSTGD